MSNESIMKYMFATNINGTEESGIIDMDVMKLICICPKENSELLLQALNKQFIENNKIKKND